MPPESCISTIQMAYVLALGKTESFDGFRNSWNQIIYLQRDPSLQIPVSYLPAHSNC